MDALIIILAGTHDLVEANKRVRLDRTLQQASDRYRRAVHKELLCIKLTHSPLVYVRGFRPAGDSASRR